MPQPVTCAFAEIEAKNKETNKKNLIKPPKFCIWEAYQNHLYSTIGVARNVEIGMTVNPAWDPTEDGREAREAPQGVTLRCVPTCSNFDTSQEQKKQNPLRSLCDRNGP